MIFLLGALPLLVAIACFATPYMLCASIAYCLMVTGLINLKQRRRHAALMSTAIALDVGLVLVLELQRDAINTAVSLSLSPLQMAHVGSSSVATLLYFPVLFLGFQRLFKPSAPLWMRTWHIRLGVAAFVFRSLGFVFMFSLLAHVLRDKF